jgi:hypothetical protein
MMRYRLRTLLILLALAPPLIWAGWLAWERYAEYRHRQAVLVTVPDGGVVLLIPTAPVQPDDK